MRLPYTAPGWKTAPISPTCQHLNGCAQLPDFCGKPTNFAYPAHGGGWMALCALHGKSHLPHIFNIEEVIASGEKFEGALTGRIILARCECGSILSEEDLRTGYRNAATDRPMCEGCWDAAVDENV
jgi:hypothetical protein